MRNPTSIQFIAPWCFTPPAPMNTEVGSTIKTDRELNSTGETYPYITIEAPFKIASVLYRQTEKPSTDGSAAQAL